jgi:hypothetical protein
MFLLLIVRYHHCARIAQFGEALILVGNGKTGATVLGSVHSDL